MRPSTHNPELTFTTRSGLFFKSRRARYLYGLLFISSVTYMCSRYLTHLIHVANWIVESEEDVRFLTNVDFTLNYGARLDVRTTTPWKAPIMWEGMFDATVFDRMHITFKSSVAVTVFAVGRYLDVYLENFLTSAERHFMLGLRVTYYVFTDAPENVPKIKLGALRQLKAIKVEKEERWQDISMMRMKTISHVIDAEIRYQFRYVFAFDVDQVFVGRFGTEALGNSVAQLHSHFYNLPKDRFTYEKNPNSTAFLMSGDFYYHAAVFGGFWENVKKLTDTCYQSIVKDKNNDIEALWHDESHLNKYFWLHKPTKVLSPEYCWDRRLPFKDIHRKRLIWAPKYYPQVRPVGEWDWNEVPSAEKENE